MATQFPLKFTAGSAQSLEELAEVFDSITLIGYYKDGRLTRWLEAWYYPDEANAMKNVDASQKDDDLLLSLVKILGFSEQQIKNGKQRSQKTVSQQNNGKTCELSSAKADQNSASETAVTNIDGCKISWNIQPASSPPDLETIVRFKGKFVGISLIDSSRIIFFSEDGISWSFVKELRDDGAKLTVVNDYIVLLNRNKYLFSHDGKTWQSAEPPDCVVNIHWNGDQYILHVRAIKIYHYGKKSWFSNDQIDGCDADYIFISKSLEGPWELTEEQPCPYRSSQSSTWFKDALFLPEVLDLKTAERVNFESKCKDGLNTTKDFKNYRIFRLPFKTSELLDPIDLDITNNSKLCFLICSQDALVESGNPTAYYFEVVGNWHPMQENFISLKACDQILVGKTTENKSFFSVNGIDWKEFEIPPKTKAWTLDGQKIYCVLKDGFAVSSITPEK